MFHDHSWYIVHTKHQQDRICAEALERKRFGVYLPMGQRIVKHARREEVVMRPALGRYLFVGFDPEGQLGRMMSEVKRTIGVEWMIQPAGTRAPLPVPPSIVEALRAAEDAGFFDDPKCIRIRDGQTMVARLPRCGDLVRVMEGPFAGFLAEVARAPSENRIEIVIKHARMGGRFTTSLAKLEKVA